MSVQGFRGAIVRAVEQQVGAGSLKSLLSEPTISFGEQPDNPNPKLPYMIFTDDGEDVEYMGVGVKETHVVTFVYFSDSLESAESIETALKNLFDPHGKGLLLTLTNGQVTGGGKFLPGGRIEKIRKPQRTTSGQWQYKGTFPYKTVVNR